MVGGVTIVRERGGVAEVCDPSEGERVGWGCDHSEGERQRMGWGCDHSEGEGEGVNLLIKPANQTC